MASFLSFPAAQYCRVLWGFSIGRYGWSESFIRPFAGQSFQQMRDNAKVVAKRRMEMSGGGVFMDTIRLSDIAVRRDADDTQVNLRARNLADTSEPNFAFTEIITAVDSPSYNPNICIVCRVEGANKVYHGQHSLGGMPLAKFTSGERLVNLAAWTAAFNAWRDDLRDFNYGFLCLDRVSDGNQDLRVRSIDGDSQTFTVSAIPDNWRVGDRIRIINAVVPGKRRGGSIVGRLIALDATSATFKAPGPIPPLADVGPQTICHREETAFVPISAMQPEYASHRNRGRPLFSPRGRRSRT